MNITKTPPTTMPTKTIGPFLAIAFGLTWGLAALLFLFYDQVVAICIILTPMFNASRGSLLIPVLYHFQMNNPLWPDAQPWDTLIFVIVAVIIVWLNRDRMFRREDGVTAVLSTAPRIHFEVTGR